jgi:hypothetical protein
MQMVARSERPNTAAPGGEHMIRKTRLAAAFALGAGLTAAGVALAQTQPGSATSPAASAQPALPPTQSTLPSVRSDASTIKPLDPDFSQRTYSVNPPPDNSSDLTVPAAIGGYARSAAGCVVIGCDDGPQVGGSSGAPWSGSAEPPSANPGSSGPR